MITKEKILEILDKYAKDNFGINSTYIDNLEFEDLAEELVKNCSIPYVSNNEVADCRHRHYHIEETAVVVCTNCDKILGRQTDC